MGEVLALMNEKGGVGKSILTFSCAWSMAADQKRVLVIDMDGQKANFTYLAGIKTDAATKTMEDVLLRGVDPSECIVNVYQSEDGYLDVIPASLQMVNIPSTAKISTMKKTIQSLRGGYDYIFLDVNPSPDWRHALTLSVLDGVCVLMLPDILSLEANRGIFDSIEEIQAGVNPNLKIVGFILNQFDNRTRLAKAVREKADQMAQACGSQVFDASVRKTVVLSESAAAHKGVTYYAPNSAVAEDVRSLTNEIIAKL